MIKLLLLKKRSRCWSIYWAKKKRMINCGCFRTDTSWFFYSGYINSRTKKQPVFVCCEPILFFIGIYLLSKYLYTWPMVRWDYRPIPFFGFQVLFWNLDFRLLDQDLKVRQDESRFCSFQPVNNNDLRSFYLNNKKNVLQIYLP